MHPSNSTMSKATVNKIVKNYYLSWKHYSLIISVVSYLVRFGNVCLQVFIIKVYLWIKDIIEIDETYNSKTCGGTLYVLMIADVVLTFTVIKIATKKPAYPRFFMPIDNSMQRAYNNHRSYLKILIHMLD